MPTIELVCVWSMLTEGRIRPLELRTWLASREVAERRKFGSRGKQPRFTVQEIADLVGGGGESAVRASLRRLAKVGLVRWSPNGPRFIASVKELAVDDVTGVTALASLMPAGRRTFPLPRRLGRLMAGGLKRSVLACIFGHLLRCPRYTRTLGWTGVGACKASWIAEAFGMSLRSVREARAHLMHELGWLTRIESPQWHQNRYGGRFEVNLTWSGAAERSPAKGSVAHRESAPLEGRNGTVSAPPESKQPSLQGEIYPSTPRGVAPGPPDESFRGSEDKELGAPNLSKLVRADLRDTSRVMELFDQALSSRLWKSRGWAPSEGHLQRLNWAAAARRANVRGGSNPCGLFIHLVTRGKWDHISNDDEDAVRRDVARWMNPEPGANEGTARGGGVGAQRARLTEDAKKLRYLEGVLRNRRLEWSPVRIEQELARYGWSQERVVGARQSLEAWKSGGLESCPGPLRQVGSVL
ncbi:MAG: hypothetical protein AAFU73_15715 [Planctomycetota bacterium]